MLNDCIPKVLYVHHEPSPIWMVSFYHDDIPRVALFSTEIFDEETVQVSCNDPANMYNLYKSWMVERGLKQFRYWTLEDQYSFYRLLLENCERQLKLYGELPPFAKSILSRQHDLPGEKEIEPYEALSIAYVSMQSSQGIDYKADKTLQYSIMFFRTEDRTPVYLIRFFRNTKEVFSISIRGNTGDVLSLSDRGEKAQ